MKRILVPTDFSENSLNALNYARIIYKNFETTFFLLHTYENLSAGPITPEVDSEWLDAKSVKVTADLKQLLKDTKKTNDNPKHSFSIISRPTSFIEAVKEVAKTEAIDCIVMGAKGARGAFDIFMGSKAVKLVNKVNYLPIIIVPKIYVPKEPSKIVFSTNFKRAFDKNELDTLFILGKSLRCSLKIVQVMSEKNLNDFQRANKEILRDIVKELNFGFRILDVASTETAAIKEFVMISDSDMIALVNHKLNFLYTLIQENVVRKVAFQSPVPLLVLPELVKTDAKPS